eukprot:CAMPEP_0170481816 /NCGR_PEP_ID=MMETSP0208-20121228/2115_1 /TAXON_ID=197538 /ORGANISM="Strombidium inclinatum, Strain S3" /LENGTH=134 /DNA_ID=CAMNT_0010754587 /DNA_START=165 /DNA_END=570 /DNA_ORIENTATION=+
MEFRRQEAGDSEDSAHLEGLYWPLPVHEQEVIRNGGEAEQVLQRKAKIIQKYFRGYFSRRYEHDFYARKNYLSDVQTKNEEIRKELEEWAKKTALEEAKLQEQTARTEFHELASNLHHLASTRIIPGVYNPPYS